MSRYEDGALTFALSLADGIGQIMLQHFRTGEPGIIKPDGTVQTVADRLAAELVQQRISAERPRNEAIITEETGRGLAWVIDETDGSWLNEAGVATGMTLIALVRDGVPILGVGRNPYTNDTLHSVRGGPAFLNGGVIRVNQNRHVAKSTIIVPGNNVDSLDASKLFAEVLKQKGEVTISGSAGYDGMLVSTGFASACVYPYWAEHDMAAVEVITAGAGGLVLSLRGLQQRYDQVIDGAVVMNGEEVFQAEMMEMLAGCLTPAADS